MVAEISVSRTKIITPILPPQILHRARLLALFEVLLDKKLMLVTAPAGYGKTSLLVDFARQSDVPVCWLSLDALDQDPQRFWAYLIAALGQRFPKFGKQSRSVLRSMVSFEQDSERLLTALVNEIDGQIDQHFALVVDDFQFVDSVPDIRNLFSRFVMLAGENCHIILASRRLPALPDITLMVARQQVSGFNLEELAFRNEEIQALFENNFGMHLDEAAIQGLMEQTEGWITGLQLSGTSVTSGQPELRRAARTAGVDMAGYLDQQVLAPLTAKLRNFMLHTSLLEVFDAELCEAVFGKGDWKRLIKTIRENNLFALQVGPDGRWLRYHPIFEEFLQQRVREEEPELVRTTLLRLAEVYEKQGEWEKAYSICRQLNDSGLLSAMIERAGMPMLLSERLITLRAWLDTLPTDLFQSHPGLLSLKGALLCNMGEGHLALFALDQTIPEFQKTADIPALALAFVRRAGAYRLVGDYDRSLKDADEALRLSEGKPEIQFTFAEAERAKGIGLHHLGQIAEAVKVQEEALLRYQQLGDKQRAAWVQMELGMNYRSGGNYPAALDSYNHALDEWRQETNLPSQANAFNSLGVLHQYLGDYEQAGRAFEAGLECAKSSNSQWLVSFLLIGLGEMYVDLGEYDSAFRAYGEAELIAQGVSFQFLTNYLGLAKAHLARLQERFEDADAYLNKVEAPILTSDSDYECGLYSLEHGCLQLAEEKSISARAELERALDYFQRGGLVAETAWSRVWLAAAHFKTGNVAAAREQLSIALGTGPSGPLLHTIRLTVSQARPWLKDLQEDAEAKAILAPWLESVVSAESHLPDLRKRLRRLLRTVPIQVPYLVIQAFGKAQVRVNGKLVTTGQWKTASVRELFFYFLAASRPTSKEEIGEILWPELDTHELKLRFKNELYRLRHALGPDVIRLENDLYSFNRRLDYVYDVEKFSNALASAKSANRLEEKVSHLREATSFRNGAYLLDVDATWVWPERERLDRACTDALRQLADSQHQTGDILAAIQTCQEALKIDPAREDIHRLAMQYHSERGDRLGIIWQYQACQEALRSELDVDPSRETEALYRRLIV